MTIEKQKCEKGFNTFKSEMIIIKYKKSTDVDIFFPKYNWTTKNRLYGDFKRGKIKCPYEPRYFGKGYSGEGRYNMSLNGRMTKVYIVWNSMLQRCYDSNYHKRHPSYKKCEVCEEWLNFQNFAKWYEENYYEVEGRKMCLDKDILVKGNKIYSPKTCVFVPDNINLLLVKGDIVRGKYPIGVSYHDASNKFIVQCHNSGGKRFYLGSFNDEIKAFNAYKTTKENVIKEIADKYKNQIPKELYEALYLYQVEITD